MISTNLNFANPSVGSVPRVAFSSGSGPRTFNESYLLQKVNIVSARDKHFNLHDDGFEIIELKSACINYNSEECVASTYYIQVEDLVKRVSGATHVFVIGHHIRRGAIYQPALHAHVDFTESGAQEQVEKIINSSGLRSLKGKRFIQINAWRSINGTVEQMPLAVLDSKTLCEEDLIVAEIADNIVSGKENFLAEFYALKYNPTQRWYYYPSMQEEEILLFKGYDAKRNMSSRFAPHTAFLDPTSKPDALPRQSIEIRAFAFFE